MCVGPDVGQLVPEVGTGRSGGDERPAVERGALADVGSVPVTGAQLGRTAAPAERHVLVVPVDAGDVAGGVPRHHRPDVLLGDEVDDACGAVGDVAGGGIG